MRKLRSPKPFRCHYCKAELLLSFDRRLRCGTYRVPPNFATIDHLMPVSRGGSDDLSNLVRCCFRCNVLKGAMTEKEFKDAISSGSFS